MKYADEDEWWEYVKKQFRDTEVMHANDEDFGIDTSELKKQGMILKIDNYFIWSRNKKIKELGI